MHFFLVLEGGVVNQEFYIFWSYLSEPKELLRYFDKNEEFITCMFFLWEILKKILQSGKNMQTNIKKQRRRDSENNV